ncbi:MAG: alkyl hydroperoxide reductase/Thiol specific antioxidant/Mal allergen, partial [Segetibacter sp.]|nr:alkyl hydroperoxide reductase/Thiol specific antioxidant/Mal allergen [Segetibacter sp.]
MQCYVVICTLVCDANEYPTVGKTCPNFNIKNILFYQRSSININELRGKWIVLDFWHKYCSSCVSSFAETNAMQKEFHNEVQFFLIGRQDEKNEIRKIYDRFRKKLELGLAVTFDSSLHKQLDVGACPYIIVIDTAGIVRAITLKISSKTIKDFLTGHEPFLEKAFRQNEDRAFPYDKNIPLLIAGNGGVESTFLYRSLLTPWQSELPEMTTESMAGFLSISKTSGFETLGASITDLYKYAYLGVYGWGFSDTQYGRYAKWPILEIKNKSSFESDRASGKSYYSYSVIVPPKKRTIKFLQKIMQNDLANYFGYIGKIENRIMPYWKLVIVDSSKISFLFNRTVDHSKLFVNHTMFYTVNQPVSYLLARIWANFQDVPLIDATGIAGNITLVEDAIMTDFDDMRRALKKYGLDLV